MLGSAAWLWKSPSAGASARTAGDALARHRRHYRAPLASSLAYPLQTGASGTVTAAFATERTPQSSRASAVQAWRLLHDHPQVCLPPDLLAGLLEESLQAQVDMAHFVPLRGNALATVRDPTASGVTLAYPSGPLADVLHIKHFSHYGRLG